MLRVGLTGGLGSGKSTVAGMFAELGAAVMSADQLGRQLMEPGEPVYTAIVQTFGGGVVRGDGSLDRRALAELAFQHNRADALNRIVHPAVVAAQQEWMRGVFAKDPGRVAVVESALIFEVEKWGTAPGWVERFDRLILVTVPDEVKIARFVARTHAVETDARARLAMQIRDEEKAARCDFVIDNSGTVEETRRAVEGIYRELVLAAE
jgi:dephospho-CoA kinase